MRSHRWIILVLLISLLVSWFTLTGYGEGWDELLLHRYADRSLNAYKTWMQEGAVSITLDDLGSYGPAFLMLDELIYHSISPILPLHPTDIYHLLNFITFLAGVWALYDASIRWLPSLSAMGAVLLLVTQPVFWGHAFMNSKDIPFFAFFLLSLAFGFRMMDSYRPIRISAPSAQIRRMLVLLSAAGLVSVLGLFAFTGVIHSAIDNLVGSAAAGNENIVSLVASHIRDAPPEDYIQKFFILFLRVRLAYVLFATALLTFLYYRYSRSTLAMIVPILIPGVLLGFTTSVRILGPFAGLIVAVYGFRNRGRETLPLVFLYAMVGIISMYLTWPYLWENPIGHFIESLRVMSSYPWNGLVLFDGQRYISTKLPYSYLPVLLGIQLTEPVWLLFLIGFLLAIVQITKKQDDQTSAKAGLLELTLIWFVLPILGFIIFRPSLYDNFRQVFFLLPSVFLMAGLAFSRIKAPQWQLALIALAILPGIVDGIRIHPYEYIYYNRFVGGIAGAQNRFELDYWGTSYRAAAEYVNSVAPANAPVWVEGPAHLFDSFARKDLKVLDAFNPALLGKSYYAVALARYDLEKVISAHTKTIYTVTCNGIPLTVIKQSEGTVSNDSN
jgi:hypothetical protein